MMTRLKHFYRQHVVAVTLLFFLIVSIVMVAIVYLQPNKILSGADYHFHMNRVENLALSIKHGDFFPKISYFFIGEWAMPQVFFTQMPFFIYQQF